MLVRARRLSLRTSRARSVNSHIWPKSGQIWGTLIGGTETFPALDEIANSFIRGDNSSLLEENFGHHAFVLVTEQVAVEERHPFDDRVGEVHDEVDGSVVVRNIDGVEPLGRAGSAAIFLIRKEVNLMDMK